MRVAQISTWQTPCGIAGYTSMLRAALSAAGVATDIVPIDRARLRYLPVRELKQQIDALGEESSKADVVHIQHEFAFFAGAHGWRTSIDLFNGLLRQLRGKGCAVAVTFHTEPSFRAHDRDGALQLARQVALRALWSSTVGRRFMQDSAMAGVVHTRSSRLALIRSGLPAGRVHVLSHGTPPFGPAVESEDERRLLKQKLGFPADARVLSIFGFISAYKGYRTAIRALDKLPAEYHLAVVGAPHPFSDDAALDDLLGLASRLGVTERVKVTGYLSTAQVNEHLAITDVCLAPYHPQPRLASSAALTWALASGRPVIASRISAFTELNEDYDCLEMIAPRAPNELAYQVMALEANPERVAALVDNARRYCDDHQWSRVAHQHVALYNRLLGSPVPLHVSDSAERLSAVGS